MKREVVATRTQSDVTAGNACWETPPLVFAAMAQSFGPFDVDLAADAQRALCARWLGPGSRLCEDVLEGNWKRFGSSGYCNPPYGPFVKRLIPMAAMQAHARGFSSTLLLPMRITRTFLYGILPHANELYVCSRRITFFENGGPRVTASGASAPAMFDSMIVRFTGPRKGELAIKVWEVPAHVDTPMTRRDAILVNEHLRRQKG